MKGRICRNQQGSAAVEFAFAAPVLLLVIIGLVQLGILFSAQAGIANAVNEAARFATTFPTPTDGQIIERMKQRRFMVRAEHMAVPAPVRGISNGVAYIDLTMTYSAPLNFVFFSTQPIPLRQTRRA
jgi:Flp pilus assembly pilin Flp